MYGSTNTNSISAKTSNKETQKASQRPEWRAAEQVLLSDSDEIAEDIDIYRAAWAGQPWERLHQELDQKEGLIAVGCVSDPYETGDGKLLLLLLSDTNTQNILSLSTLQQQHTNNRGK